MTPFRTRAMLRPTMNRESRIQVSEEVDSIAAAVARKSGLSKPRVLGTFARYGQAAGAASILGPIGMTIDSLAPRRTAKSVLERRAR